MCVCLCVTRSQVLRYDVQQRIFNAPLSALQARANICVLLYKPTASIDASHNFAASASSCASLETGASSKPSARVDALEVADGAEK